MFTAILIVHVIAAAAAAGVWLAAAGFRIRARHLPPEQAGPLLLGAMSTANFLSWIALLFLWATGGAMLYLIEGLAETGGLWFAAKGALVILITILQIPIQVLNRQVARGIDAEAAAIARDRYSHIMLVLGICALALAVIAFR